MAMKHSIARTLVKYVSKKPHRRLVSASALIVAIASLDEARAAGETVGYSAPFLFAQFEVILQDRTATEAKKAGLNLLNPTNADNDSGKQITDVRNLVGAGAKGLIVVANDSKAIIPALDYAASKNVPVVSTTSDLTAANSMPSFARTTAEWAGSPARKWPRPLAIRARCYRCKARFPRSMAESEARGSTIA